MSNRILIGKWEEILKHTEEPAGCNVRVIVLADATEEPYPGIAPEAHLSTAGSLLKYMGT